MAEVTDVDITAGIPTGGTGTVPTLSKTNTVLGAVNETAPATDTASSGLNGRLQRIAQNLTALFTTQAGYLDGIEGLLARPGLNASVSVTRPSNTNTYGAGDVVGVTGGGTAALDFNLAAISASCIEIRSVSFKRDVAALISGETSYILHLYDVTPPSALVDENTWDLPSGDRASYLGAINLGTPVDLGSTLYIELNAVNKMVKLAGTHIFGYLVTVGGYVAASASVHKLTINAIQL